MLADRLGDSVRYLGHLRKHELYSAYLTAGVYAYPVPSKISKDFDEISCISAMEAQACGLPFVSTARGALPETLAAGAGTLVPWSGDHTPEYFDAFADACLKYMRDPAAHKQASETGLAHGATLDWDRVAEEWSELFEREITAASSDKATLANHFWRHSDIYAAKKCLEQLPLDDAKSAGIREIIARDWAFIDEPDGFRKQYEKIGATHNPDVINWAPQEPRYAALREWLQSRIDTLPEGQVLSVLDYGCAHGAYATNLLKELPRLKITGVDIDQRGIEMAYGFAEKLGVSDRWRGVVGDFERLADESLPEFSDRYDIVLAQEVLEHVPDPVGVMRALERLLKDGGIMYLTTPFGPWEYSDYRRYPFRAHVWEFDLHDLHELLDVKGLEGEVTKRVMPFGMSGESDEPLGWIVTTFVVTEATRGKFGEIDWDRKLWLQRPRQTVSASIMAGGDAAEETLHWCLRSLENLVDELVIVDCGLSDEAKRIVEQYRWGELDGTRKHWFPRLIVVPGVDPKTEGFETPRNIGLKECTQDFVLWIDTDEKLLQPQALTKFLRRNIYQGYSIRQHHFAVDTFFEPDLPVRLFRNNGKLRFVGMIHEHPESEVNEGPGRTIVIGDSHIAHVGYLIESGRRARFMRNYPMLEADQKRYPDRKLQKHMIMRDEIMLCTYELEMNGKRVTPQIRERCHRVISLWREHFRGKGHFTNSDPTQYYSQAVSILGEGFDFALQVGADKMEAKINGAQRIRFANMEDMEAEVSFRARVAAEPFASRYY